MPAVGSGPGAGLGLGCLRDPRRRPQGPKARLLLMVLLAAPNTRNRVAEIFRGIASERQCFAWNPARLFGDRLRA